MRCFKTILAVCTLGSAVGCDNIENDFSCLTESSRPPRPQVIDYLEAAPLPSAATIAGTLIDLKNSKPLEGVTVRACLSNDAACSLVMADDQSDPQGAFALKVLWGPEGFDGYLEYSGKDLYPTMDFISPPLRKSITNRKVILLKKKQFKKFAKRARATLLQDRGHLGFRVEDCKGNPAKGVRVTTDRQDEMSSSIYVYLRTARRKKTKTSKTGVGAIFDLNPGDTLVSAHFPNGFTIQRKVNIRAGYASQVLLHP